MGKKIAWWVALALATLLVFATLCSMASSSSNPAGPGVRIGDNKGPVYLALILASDDTGVVDEAVLRHQNTHRMLDQPIMVTMSPEEDACREFHTFLQALRTLMHAAVQKPRLTVADSVHFQKDLDSALIRTVIVNREFIARYPGDGDYPCAGVSFLNRAVGMVDLMAKRKISFSRITPGYTLEQAQAEILHMMEVDPPRPVKTVPRISAT